MPSVYIHRLLCAHSFIHHLFLQQTDIRWQACAMPWGYRGAYIPARGVYKLGMFYKATCGMWPHMDSLWSRNEHGRSICQSLVPTLGIETLNSHLSPELLTPHLDSHTHLAPTKLPLPNTYSLYCLTRSTWKPERSLAPELAT